MNQPETSTQATPLDPAAKNPPQLPYIIVNEGCERFSFYGMRNILKTFLATSMFAYLPLAERDAAAKDVFHSFVIGVYFFPLLGGWIADRLWGKYRTILALSLVYCVGHGCLALFEDNQQGFFTGLFLIALGSGGIKPLVASFMGDQFTQRNKHLAKAAFDAFYWIINFGSFFASLIMPKLLKESASLAFGIPGILMLIATTVFWLGRKRYVTVPLPPKHPDAFARVVMSALTTANGKTPVGLIIATSGVVLAVAALGLIPILGFVASACLALVIFLAFISVGTWMQLDRALGKHPAEAVEGVRSVFRILIVFALVTPFHSLFDQKATTWVTQAEAMVKPGWFEPAQMQALNPALVMLLIPLCSFVLYPWLRRVGYDPTPLRRMTAGIISAGFSWIIIGVMQLSMDNGNQLSIVWQVLPYAFLTLGEVWISATGLEFAYSQAPTSMKGIIMSFWLLTTTVGNLWVLLVDAAIRNQSVLGRIQETGISETAFLMFFFAGFAFLAGVGFYLYGKRYRMQDNYLADASA